MKKRKNKLENLIKYITMVGGYDGFDNIDLIRFTHPNIQLDDDCFRFIDYLRNNNDRELPSVSYSDLINWRDWRIDMSKVIVNEYISNCRKEKINQIIK